jgi:histone H3/H4
VYRSAIQGTINVEQKNTSLITSTYKLKKLCLELAQDYCTTIGLTDNACRALQTAVEEHMIRVFKGANAIATHGGRTHVSEEDIRLAEKLINAQHLL